MSSFTIVVHPDNTQKLRESIRKSDVFAGEFGEYFYMKSHESSFDVIGVRLRGESFVEPSEKTGRYILPGGRAVPADQVNVVKGFITYGPEDLSWLLYAGIVVPEVVYPIYVISDRFSMDSPVFDPDISFVPPPKLEWRVNHDPSPTMFRPKFIRPDFS